MAKLPEEWLRQADYDMDTADFMSEGGRHFYAVFMCHLAMEKALKGLFQAKLGEEPPKTHNLIYLVERIKLELPTELQDFVPMLNGVSVPTRYPDDLQRLLKEFSEAKIKNLLARGRETLTWLRAQL